MAGQILEATRQQAGANMRRLAAVARLQLPDVQLLVNEGDIRDSLLKRIKEDAIELVVMGTHGRGGLERLMLGSVTERIVHQATCPVLVVCRPVRDFVAPEEAVPVDLRTILLATDFSSNSSRAVAEAIQWASEWSAKLILFHAVEEVPPKAMGRVDLFPEYNRYFEKQLVVARETIQKQVSSAVNKNFEISSEVRHGNPKEQILRVAEEKNADLIVMGTKGITNTASVWGSTISAVLRDGRFPVLALPHVSN